jgi:hypothetical protein
MDDTQRAIDDMILMIQKEKDKKFEEEIKKIIVLLSFCNNFTCSTVRF